MRSAAPIGILVNPVSGRDIRRLVTSAAHSTLQEKVAIVRRVVIGAAEVGADRFLFLPEPHAIWRRATQTLELDARLEPLPLAVRYREEDTTRAAEALRAAGCAVIVVLGGDGTNRAVVKGWPDAALIPLSTGTNNVFPYFVEPTLAGAAAGLLATGGLDLARISARAKLVEVEVEHEPDDVALVDAVSVAERVVGSLALFDPSKLGTGVFARAEPASIGLSAIAGLLEPCGPELERGVALRFAPGGAPASRRVRAPLAPGYYLEVGVAEVRRLAFEEPVEVRGPGLLALDGERKRVLAPDQRARLRVARRGPRVVDVPLALAQAAAQGAFGGGVRRGGG